MHKAKSKQSHKRIPFELKDRNPPLEDLTVSNSNSSVQQNFVEESPLPLETSTETKPTSESEATSNMNEVIIVPEVPAHLRETDPKQNVPWQVIPTFQQSHLDPAIFYFITLKPDSQSLSLGSFFSYLN